MWICQWVVLTIKAIDCSLRMAKVVKPLKKVSGHLRQEFIEAGMPAGRGAWGESMSLGQVKEVGRMRPCGGCNHGKLIPCLVSPAGGVVNSFHIWHWCADTGIWVQPVVWMDHVGNWVHWETLLHVCGHFRNTLIKCKPYLKLHTWGVRMLCLVPYWKTWSKLCNYMY